MMKTTVFLISFACVIGCDAPQSTDKDTPKGNMFSVASYDSDLIDDENAQHFVDMKSISGEWVLESIFRDGKVDGQSGAKYLFEDGTLTVSPTGFRPSFYEIRLRNGDHYTELDIVANWSDGRPPDVAETLCKLDDDKLIWCYANNGKRPTKFLDPSDRYGTVIVLARPSLLDEAE